MNDCSLLIVHAGEVATVAAETPAAAVSTAALARWLDAAVAVRGETIVEVGATRDLEARWRAETRLDAEGKAVTAALADPHTHLVFAGGRQAEFTARVSGRPLPPGLGGGIGETVRATAAASDAALVGAVRRRLDRWLGAGVTLVECKSGYGLTVEGELRLLEVAGRAAHGHRLEMVRTLLAAHALPPAYEGRETDYLDEVAWPAALAAHERGFAECVDVFIERGAFTAAAARPYLERCRALGLTPRVHADQLTRSGGTEVAVAVAAASADHLEQASAAEVARLSGSRVTAILTPGAVLTLEGRGGVRPPARALLEAGVPVALASDYNPGTSTQTSPSLTPSLAARLFGMTPDETLAGVTAAAAQALGRGERLGRVAPGYQADLCVWPFAKAADLAYQLGEHVPERVLVRGRVVAEGGRLLE